MSDIVIAFTFVWMFVLRVEKDILGKIDKTFYVCLHFLGNLQCC